MPPCRHQRPLWAGHGKVTGGVTRAWCPGGGGATQSVKGYQLRYDLSEAVAVMSQDGYKKGGCPVIISPKRVAIIVLIANSIHQKTIMFVLIIHKYSQKYTLVG